MPDATPPPLWAKETRVALQLAAQESQRRNSPEADTLDVLVGLLKCADSRAAQLLARAGLDLRTVRDAAEAVLGEPVWGVKTERVTLPAPTAVNTQNAVRRPPDYFTVGTEAEIRALIASGADSFASVLVTGTPFVTRPPDDVKPDHIV